MKLIPQESLKELSTIFPFMKQFIDHLLSFNPDMKIVLIGLPAGIQSSLFAISNVTIQTAVNSFESTFITLF